LAALAMIGAVLLVNVAGQVSGPAESAIVPLVVPEAARPGRVDALLRRGSRECGGTAVLAPILVTLFGVRPLIFVAVLPRHVTAR
jgi:hypothetical protein